MNNYLVNSTNYGGTINDKTTGPKGNQNYGYWLMNAHSSVLNPSWDLDYSGGVGYINTSDVINGARAVVEINK